MSERIRIIIVDPDPQARRRVRSAFDHDPRIEVVDEAVDLDEATALAASLTAAFILLEVPAAAASC